MIKSITIGIQGKGSSTVGDLEILARLLEKQTGMKLVGRQEGQVLPRLDWIHKGEIDLFYEGASAISYIEGKLPEEIERWRGPFPLRIVASAHSGCFGFIVRADSPIKNIYDITPKTRIATSPMGGDMVYHLLAWLKLNKGPVMDPIRKGEWNANIIDFTTWDDNLRSISEGKADVAGVTVENPVVKEAALKAPGIRFLDLPAKTDPEGAKRFGNPAMLIPAPKYGVKEAWGVTCQVGTACVWCRPEFDRKLAYDLTKWFDVNYDLYKDQGNKLRTYDRHALRVTFDSAMAPVHPGTVDYFKEIGMWHPADDARGEFNEKVMDWYVELWTKAIAEADRRGLTVSSTSQPWVELWTSVKNKAGVPAYQTRTDAEIKEGLTLLRKQGR